VLTQGIILSAVRILLGVTEAGLYPGIVFYITRYIPTFSSLFDVHLTRDHPYSWYKRSEMGSRIALFFSSATVAGAFSQFFIAFREGTLFSHNFPEAVCFPPPFLKWTELVEDQVRMYFAGILSCVRCCLCFQKGWEWIFILEGLATIAIAMASYWVIQDFPDTATFLTQEERKKLKLFDCKQSKIG
jgi:MFS family permease